MKELGREIESEKVIDRKRGRETDRLREIIIKDN
jgi:hypothetical protein